ncbi:MAG: S8 family peptidase [Candidatus Hodarchaeales archaeon]|jgi:subtilisin family serine protease
MIKSSRNIQFITLFLLIFFVFIDVNSSINNNERGTWQYEAIGFTDKVSQLTKGNSEVIIAIIDGGVDFSHKDLGEHLRWSNPGEIPNNDLDDDENGYVDDIFGWDFFDNDNDPSPVANNIDDNNDDRIDEFVSHGTFIAGIISGQGLELRGIVPNIKILNIKIYDSDGVSRGGTIEEAWRYVATFGSYINVINFSSGLSEGAFFNLNQTFETLLNKHDVIIVASSGNEESLTISGTVDYPGRHPDILSVGAVGKEKTIWKFSMRGTGLDLVAPGENVVSTVLNDYYTDGTGTSFAAPFVTGAAAFIQSLSLESPLTGAEIRSFIKNTTTDLGDEGYDSDYGAGLLNMSNLIESLPIQSSTGLFGWQMSSTFVFCFLILIGNNIRNRIRKRKY